MGQTINQTIGQYSTYSTNTRAGMRRDKPMADGPLNIVLHTPTYVHQIP